VRGRASTAWTAVAGESVATTATWLSPVSRRGPVRVRADPKGGRCEPGDVLGCLVHLALTDSRLVTQRATTTSGAKEMSP
jgi:hypothetical protein